MATHLPKLILASRSPRRRELLAAAGYAFEVLPPSEAAECGVCSGETPAAACRPPGLSEGGRRGAADRPGTGPRLRHRGRMPGPDPRQAGRPGARPGDAEDSQRPGASRPQRAVPVAGARRPARGSRGRDHAAHGPAHAAATREYLAGGQWEGKAGRSATRTASIGSTSSKAASRTSSDCRWNCWPRWCERTRSVSRDRRLACGTSRGAVQAARERTKDEPLAYRFPARVATDRHTPRNRRRAARSLTPCRARGRPRTTSRPCP